MNLMLLLNTCCNKAKYPLWWYLPKTLNIVVIVGTVEASNNVDKFVECSDAVVSSGRYIFQQWMTEPTICSHVISFDQRDWTATC